MQEPTITTPSSPRGTSWGNRTAESNVSGVSWAAIFAGAAAAAALSLILTILGFGLGLSAISPWGGDSGASATTIGISTAIWLALVQIAAAGLGGYLAGRLRVRWAGLHTDEVYFRDTAHGMLSWAVATLVTAAFMGSAITGAIGTGAQAAGKALGGVTQMATQAVASQAGDEGGSGMLSYYVDSLFRTDGQAPENPEAASREAATIMVNSLRTGQLSDSDRSYLARLVAQRTQLSQADAEKRVTDTYNEAVGAAQELEDKAREAADTARKAAAGAALWFFVALLSGAFFASLFAIYGGRHRDAVVIDDAAY